MYTLCSKHTLWKVQVVYTQKDIQLHKWFTHNTYNYTSGLHTNDIQLHKWFTHKWHTITQVVYTQRTYNYTSGLQYKSHRKVDNARQHKKWTETIHYVNNVKTVGHCVHLQCGDFLWLVKIINQWKSMKVQGRISPFKKKREDERLLSILRGHSVFSSPPQRPMTSDFEVFSIPDFSHYIYFPILILEKEPVFSLLNVQC